MIEYKGTILLGFHAGTSPIKNPRVVKNLLDAFKKYGYETVLWSMDELDNFNSIKYNTKYKGNTEYVPMLTDVERIKWRERCINRGQLPEIADDVIKDIEWYSEFIFDTINPTIYIGWNNLTFSFGIPADIAIKRGIKVFNLEAGAIMQSWRFEEYNFAKKIEYPVFDIYYSEIGKQLLKQAPIDNSSIYKQETLNEEQIHILNKKKEGKRIVLVLGTLEGDVGATKFGIEKDLILPDFEDSYSVAAKASINTYDLVVYKPHPLSTQNYNNHK